MPKVRSIADRKKELEKKIEILKVREEKQKLDQRMKELRKK